MIATAFVLMMVGLVVIYIFRDFDSAFGHWMVFGAAMLYLATLIIITYYMARWLLEVAS